MDVGELKEYLEQFEDGDEEIEVILRMQPRWPMDYSIRCMSIKKDDDGKKQLVIYEGTQLGYGKSFDDAGEDDS
jgi:alpha-D-ribose 1-methylphosphonate 5-triphosphate synthase subunit PhnI